HARRDRRGADHRREPRAAQRALETARGQSARGADDRALLDPRPRSAAARRRSLGRQSAESDPRARAGADPMSSRAKRRSIASHPSPGSLAHARDDTADRRRGADARARHRGDALRARAAARRSRERRVDPAHHLRPRRSVRARRRHPGHLSRPAFGAPHPCRGRGADRQAHGGSRVSRLLSAVLAAVAAVLLLAATAALFGHSPLALLSILVRSSVGSRFAIEGTLLKSVPLLLTGLSVVIAFRAGVWNIGGEGQFIVGALAALAAS